MNSTAQQTEDPAYLSEQIITYLGNKRALLPFIGEAVGQVCRELDKPRLRVADLFSGSGIVARYLRQYADVLYVNDLEGYCETINRCYLANRADVDLAALERYHAALRRRLDEEPLRAGFIAEMYAPQDDRDIRPGERVFFTARNARYIDTARQLIGDAPEAYRPFLLAPLLYEASVHNNTGGVFKGFYKNSATGIGQYGGDGRNALPRIMGDIELRMPVFSNFSCETHIFRQDADRLADALPALDLVYMDPPYNQHPYGSNYFMLNLIDSYRRPAAVSRVSGIPTDWNKSDYNRRQSAAECLRSLCERLRAKYLLISFSSDGFISREEMTALLAQLGEVRVTERAYNTFRGSRNLSGRALHVREYLYLVKKR